jgi:hypothetical protein
MGERSFEYYPNPNSENKNNKPPEKKSTAKKIITKAKKAGKKVGEILMMPVLGTSMGIAMSNAPEARGQDKLQKVVDAGRVAGEVWNRHEQNKNEKQRDKDREQTERERIKAQAGAEEGRQKVDINRDDQQAKTQRQTQIADTAAREGIDEADITTTDNETHIQFKRGESKEERLLRAQEEIERAKKGDFGIISSEDEAFINSIVNKKRERKTVSKEETAKYKEIIEKIIKNNRK